MKRLNVVLKAARNLVLPYQFGFVQGHYYLSPEQIAELEDTLQSGDLDIVERYENRFAELIGAGSSTSFASGRMAFYALLKTLGIGPGDEILLTGFTCAVMSNAVIRAGASPVFADIAGDTLGSSPEEIKKRITPRTKLIVAQHSFGIPCDIDRIGQVAKEHEIFLLEDCAISFDSSLDGIKVGNWGDAAIFSTDHSKPINTLIGGLLYTRNPGLHERVQQLRNTLPELSAEHQERLFKQVLFEKTYCVPDKYPRLSLISLFQAVMKRVSPRPAGSVFLDKDFFGIGSDVSSDYPYPAKMPAFLAKLGIFELDRWPRERQNRKSLLERYVAQLEEHGLAGHVPSIYRDPRRDIVPLRMAMGDFKPSRRLNRVFDSSGTWFREPIVGCPGGPESHGYPHGACSTAESLGKTLVNLPCVLPERWHAVASAELGRALP